MVLRVAVGPLEGPEARARIRTAYYAKASRYWNKDVVTKGPDEQDPVCQTISEQ